MGRPSFPGGRWGKALRREPLSAESNTGEQIWGVGVQAVGGGWMVRALWQSSGEAVAPISGAFNEDTPACDRHRGFLAAGALAELSPGQSGLGEGHREA